MAFMMESNVETLVGWFCSKYWVQISIFLEETE